MTLDEILATVFPAGHRLAHEPAGVVHGAGVCADKTTVALVGVAGGGPTGVDAALSLAGHVLEVVREGAGTPILFLVDTASQAMRRRDELLGLNEYFAHLIKVVGFAAASGHRTATLLYGGAAAGAFIATSLSTETLIAVESARPSVMDLASISRVTKLPLETLTALSRTTPVFAPGVDPLYAMGAVTDRWDGSRPLADVVAGRLRGDGGPDRRGDLGRERGGRKLAAETAQAVAALALAHVAG